MSIRIVLIEPQAADRRWVELMLAETGMECTLVSFSSAVEALEALSADPSPVDAVLMNVILPVFEVAEAVAEFRKLPALRNVRIGITVLGDSDMERVPEHCATLEKPVTADALKRFLAGYT